jgi:hypothetical protein
MRSELRGEEQQVVPFRQAQGQDDKQEPERRRQQASERPFLGEAEAGQGYAIRRFGDLHLHDRRVRRGHFGWPQYRVLRENFAVYLGDKMILAGYILAPDLSEFDALHGHEFFL